MKHLTFCLLLLLPVFLFGQTQDSGGGLPRAPQQAPCITEAEYQAVSTEINARIALWHAQGRLPYTPADNVVLFDWPVRQKPGLHYPGVYFMKITTNTGALVRRIVVASK